MQFYTVAMAETELGYPAHSIANALRTKPVPPAAYIGKVAVFSPQQIKWLSAQTGKKAIVHAHPFIWKTPWDSEKCYRFMNVTDVAKVLDVQTSKVQQMIAQAPLKPDAVAGRYKGYRPTTIAQWLGANYKALLTPEILGDLNKFPQR